MKASAEGSKTVVFAANSAWNILNFRMNLVRVLAAEGLRPVALVPPGEGEAELKRAGMPVHLIPMTADDTSPLSGFMLVVRYVQALRRIRPAAFLGFTPKPNIFGSMAASALKIPVINNVTGLGTAFIHGGLLGRLVPNLYRVALRRSHRVFFHNDEDRFHFPEKLIPLTILNALEEKPLPVYGEGANVRDWLYVEDHARALEAVLTCGVPGESYNIGGRSERTNLQVVEAICGILDRKRRRADDSPHRELIEFVADRPGHDRRYAIDCSKAERELGWSARESFESGLEKTVDWYLASEWWWRPIREKKYSGGRLGAVA